MCFFLAESGSGSGSRSRSRVLGPRDQGSGSMDLELNSWSRDKGPRNQEPRYQGTKVQGSGNKGPRFRVKGLWTKVPGTRFNDSREKFEPHTVGSKIFLYAL